VKFQSKELAMLFCLYDCKPPQVDEMCLVGTFGVFLFKTLPESLWLRASLFRSDWETV